MGKLLWCGIVMALLVSGCGSDGTPTRKNDFTPLTSITITAEYSTIAANTSARLTVTGHFSGYFDQDVTNEATWVSNAPTVATVTSTNRVKGGIVAGNAELAELTATVRGITAKIPITVSPATISSIAIVPPTSSVPLVPKGMTQQFAAIGTFSDSTTQVITFDAAWTSSDSAIATVSDLESSKGLATAVAASGTSTISATFNSGGGGADVIGSAGMTVTAPVVKTITVSPPNPTVLSVATRQFTATGTYSDGTVADITTLVLWSSSNGTLATMSGSMATTLAPGTLTISAAKDGAIGNTTLTVTGGSLSSIAVTPATLTMVKNTKTRITATGTFSNGNKRDITGAVVWEPADTGLATVTKSGGNLVWLTTVADTTLVGTTISAKAAGVTPGVATLVVNTQSPTLLTLSSSTLSLVTKTSGQLSATATFASSPLTQDVTYSDDSNNNSNCNWSSSNPSVASVGNDGFTKGRVTGLAAGTAVITADYGGKQSTATVTVTAAPTLLSVAVSCPAVSVGNRVSCTVTATYSGISPIDVTKDATAWTVGSENILAVADSINQPGDVIGVSGGSTTLTASFGSITAPTVTIIVTP